MVSLIAAVITAEAATLLSGLLSFCAYVTETMAEAATPALVMYSAAAVMTAVAVSSLSYCFCAVVEAIPSSNSPLLSIPPEAVDYSTNSQSLYHILHLKNIEYHKQSAGGP